MTKKLVNHYVKKMMSDMELRIPFEKDEYREAFASVERHRFIEDIYGYDEHLLDFKITDSASKDESAFLRHAYADSSILYFKDADGSLTSVSMPSVILAMINLSKMQPGDKVFEVGSGSGYSTALFSHIVGESGFVCGCELSKDVFTIGKSNVESLSLKNVHVENCDGGFGMKDFAPYDRIIVSCTTADITAHWVNQLKMGGMLVAPFVTRGYQVMVALKKTDKDVLDGRVYWPVRFFPMSGSFSIISHYSFSSRELKSMKKIIESSSNTDDEFSEEMRRLSADAMKSFLFFVSVRNPNAICYYPREDVSDGMGYGIFLRSGKVSGFSLLFGSKSVHWGNPEAHSMLKAEFAAYRTMGMPNLHSSRVRVFIHRDDYPVGEREYLIKRKDSLTLFSFD